MTVVMKGNKGAIVFINTGGSNNRTTKISTNVFGDNFGIVFIGPGVNIETVLMIFIAGSFNFLKEGPILASISFNRAVRKALRR